jgi:uncharacterized protein YdgA (DUF945 family)
MKKLGMLLGLVLAVLALAAAAVPWYIGWETERHFIASLGDPALKRNSPLAMALKSYERGWLHSRAVHRVSLRADPEVYFDVEHDIRQVPDPNAGWVIVQSTPRWPEKVQAAADYYFNRKAAVSVRTVVGFDRNVSMTFESPAFSKPMLAEPRVNLDWGGASGRISVTDRTRVNVALDAPHVNLSGGGVSVKFAGVAMHGDWNVAGNQADWSGETRVAIREVGFSSLSGGGTLKGLESSVVQRDQGATVMVGYSLKVKEGIAQDAEREQQGFTNAVLDLELDRLDKKALAKYFDDLSNAEHAQMSEDDYDQLVARLALNMLTDLLKGSPEMRVKRFGVQTANGDVSASAAIAFNGKDFAQGAAPFELLGRVKFTGAAQLSTRLLHGWMAQQARAQAVDALALPGAPADEAQMRMLCERIAQEQLAALEASGLLKAEGDKFVVRAELTDGRFSVNGMAADQFLAGLLAPSPVPAAGPEVPDQRT